MVPAIFHRFEGERSVRFLPGMAALLATDARAEQAALAPNRDEVGPQAVDMHVIVQVELYEVDESVHRKLAKAKRLTMEDYEKLERIYLGFDPPPKRPDKAESLFKRLAKQKPLVAGKDIYIDIGQDAALLSWKKTKRCLPTPEQIRKGERGPQAIEESVSLRIQVHISDDRRYVRARLTEKSVEIEDIEKVNAFDANENEVLAEVAFLKEFTLSQTRHIPDGGSFLLPLQFRPRAAKDGRRLVAVIVPRIYIEEEERLIRQRK